jgi:hypothetical protein
VNVHVRGFATVSSSFGLTTPAAASTVPATRALSDGAGCYSWELRLLYGTQHVPQLGKLSLFEIPPPPAS